MKNVLEHSFGSFGLSRVPGFAADAVQRNGESSSAGFRPRKESCLQFFTSGATMPGLGFSEGACGKFFGMRAKAQGVQGRDKTLPDRLVIATLLGDTLAIFFALICSFWLRFHTGLNEVGIPDSPSLGEYAGHLLFGTIALLGTLAAAGIYERQALLRFRFVSLHILKYGMLWALAFGSFSLLFRFQPQISRIFIGLVAVITPLTLLGWRALFHGLLLRSSALSTLRQRILFVGWNQEADRLSRTFGADSNTAYEVVGCVGSQQTPFENKPAVSVLGHLQDLEDILHRNAVDMVILSDVDTVKDDIVRISNVCEREMVQFKVIPSYFQILVSGLHLETVSGVPVLGVTRLPLDRFEFRVVKRLVDILGATAGLILSAPLVAIFGAIVYMESRGPIFYRQRRLGRAGVEFDIVKVRSMRINAESEGQVGWTTKDDPRRLRIGAFIRKWNIDEVPQFWNVLKGEMSLVGPRPERPELISSFKHDIPHYNARHNAKPGITGWAQVKGLRGDTDLAERIRCDLWYLENWSPLLDFQIMMMTFTRHQNAC